MKEYATVRRGFFFVFSGAIFGIRWFESFCRLNGSISKKTFLGFRGFDPYRRRDGSVLEGTICKQFVSNAKNRKNLKPCRGFKSFRSLAFRIQFLKNSIFGSSNPSTRRKIENGSMEIRKNLGANLPRCCSMLVNESMYLESVFVFLIIFEVVIGSMICSQIRECACKLPSPDGELNVGGLAAL